MLRKFFEGLLFGSGFSVAFFIVAGVAVFLFMPMMFRPAGPSVSVGSQEMAPAVPSPRSGVEFHELPVEEQIKQASVIALARYEPAPDGKMRAIFKEFLKKDPNATFYYAVGDEYPSAGFYPRDGASYGDGVVVFFVGSPANMRMSMTYTGDRIHSLGDIPLELFRKKCEAPNAKSAAAGGAAR